MDLAKWVKGVFFTMMCAIIMSALYAWLLDYKVNTGGALWYVARQVEHPISKYYYSYCYLPNIHMEDGVDKALGGLLYADTTNIKETESDLSTDDGTSDNCSFSSSSSHYSTEWK